MRPKVLKERTNEALNFNSIEHEDTHNNLEHAPPPPPLNPTHTFNY